MSIFEQVGKCNINEVKKMINSGININITDINSNSLLVYASEFNMFKLLIDLGIDINYKDKVGNTILHILSLKINVLNVEKIKYILNLNIANLNIQNKKGNTLLYYIIYYRHNFDGFNLPSLLSLLIKKGANVNIINNDGFIVMHYATSTKIKKLLDPTNVKYSKRNRNLKRILKFL